MGLQTMDMKCTAHDTEKCMETVHTLFQCQDNIEMLPNTYNANIICSHIQLSFCSATLWWYRKTIEISRGNSEIHSKDKVDI